MSQPVGGVGSGSRTALVVGRWDWLGAFERTDWAMWQDHYTQRECLGKDAPAFPSTEKMCHLADVPVSAVALTRRRWGSTRACVAGLGAVVVSPPLSH